MSDVSMLVYPWDFETEGVDAVVDRIAESGVGRIQVATAYHSAEVISPRRTRRVVATAEANTVHTPLAAGAFSGLASPPSSLATGSPELFGSVKAAAGQRGLALDGWVVALHNSTLASQHPEAALLTCFGDRFTHGLCPANPAVRSYVRELFAGVAGTGLFDRVLAESISYLLFGHGHPHELWGARLDTTTRYLLSLCFCEHCVRAGEAAGVDAERLRALVAAELSRTWNAPYSAARTPDDGLELASLLINWPDLAAYTRMRLEIVSSLVAEVAELCRRDAVALDVSAAVWGRPAPLNWLEGVDVSATLRLADGFVLESYYEAVGDVVRELDHTVALARAVGDDAAPLTVALTLWEAHHGTADGLLGKVRVAREAGAARLALYNYSTASDRTFAWIPDAVGEFSGRPS